MPTENTNEEENPRLRIWMARHPLEWPNAQGEMDASNPNDGRNWADRAGGDWSRRSREDRFGYDASEFENKEEETVPGVVRAKSKGDYLHESFEDRRVLAQERKELEERKAEREAKRAERDARRAAEQESKPVRDPGVHVGERFEGTVTGVKDFGLFIDIGSGQEGLCPSSEIAEEYTDDPSSLVSEGEVFDVIVLEVDRQRGRFKVSKRLGELADDAIPAAIEQREAERLEREQARKDRKEGKFSMEDMGVKLGERVTGKVTGVQDFGVFLDIGVGSDGFCPTSELDVDWIDHPSDVAKNGDNLEVVVISFERGKIKVSRKMAMGPESEIEALVERSKRGSHFEMVKSEHGLTLGERKSGTVTGVKDFGAFVDLGVGLDAMCPTSEIDKEWVEHPSNVLEEGDEVEVIVVSLEGGRVKVSRKLAQGPDSDIPEALEREEKFARKRQRNSGGRGGDRRGRDQRGGGRGENRRGRDNRGGGGGYGRGRGGNRDSRRGGGGGSSPWGGAARRRDS